MLSLVFSASMPLLAQEKSSGEKVNEFLQDFSKRVNLHGYAQAIYNYQHKGGEESNTFEMKRAYIWADAKITDRWSMLFMYEIGKEINEYYTDYRLSNDKSLSVRFGQFKTALTMENRVSPAGSEVIDVCSEGVTYLTGCGSDPLYGVGYGRDLGLAVFGELAKGKIFYEVDVLNGQGMNQKDKNNAKDVIGRLEYRPAKGLAIAATGQIGKGHAVNTSVYNPTIQLGDNYTRNRFSAGFDYKSRPFNLHGEYVQGKDGSVTSRGAYLTGSVALKPSVVDLVGSYDYFNFNTDLGYDQHKAVLGVQWWWYKKCRFQVQYVYRSAYTTKTSFVHCANNALMCQMQIRFN